MLKKIMLCLGLLGIAAQASAPTPSGDPAGPEHQAVDVKNMSLEEIKDLSSKGYLFGYYDAIGCARSGNLDGVKFFAENDVEWKWPNSRFKACQDMFVAAVEKGQVEIVEYLVDRDENLVNKEYINDYDSYNRWTALSRAAYLGNADLVQLLLDYGADVTERAWFSATIGCKEHIFEVVSCFLDELGKNSNMINTEFSSEMTALSHAAYSGDIQLAKLLVEKGGAKVDSKALVRAVETYSGFKSEILSYLLGKLGQNSDIINGKDGEDGWTALARAALKGNIEAVKLLVEKGAKIDRKAWLSAAIGYNDHKFEILSCFLGKLGQNSDIINEKDNVSQGETALSWAIYEENLELVKLLLDYGADVNDDAWYKAAVEKDKPNIDIVNCLLEKSPGTINVPNTRGWTVLSTAVFNNHMKAVQFLVETCGAKVEAQALTAAVRKENLEILSYLLGKLDKNSGVINEKDNVGCSALSYAINRGNAKVVDWLIKEGASVDQDALFEAAKRRSVDVVKLLLEKDPSLINKKNTKGETPLQVAESKTGYSRSQEVIDFLRDFAKEHPNKE